MTNLDIKLPTRCISYYASDKSVVDGKHSYEFWMRSKLTRICADKPFSRGDVLEIQSIEENSSGTLINAKVITPEVSVTLNEFSSSNKIPTIEVAPLAIYPVGLNSPSISFDKSKLKLFKCL